MQTLSRDPNLGQAIEPVRQGSLGRVWVLELRGRCDRWAGRQLLVMPNLRPIPAARWCELRFLHFSLWSTGQSFAVSIQCIAGTEGLCAREL